MSSNLKDKVDQKLSLYDTRQRSAIEGILDNWDADDGDFVFPIVDGPPGTGKTSVGTLAAARYLLENKSGQVAYLCYTHFAVDKAKSDLYAYGFPSSKVVELHYDTTATDWGKGIYGCDADLTSASFEDMRKLKGCGVLLCTLHASKRVFNVHSKPKIIVDEFSQVSTPMFFSVLQKVFSQGCSPEGYALLGDPIQLPVISTQPLLRPNIGLFIMQRKAYDQHKLILQHRMHEDICEAVNSLRNIYGAHRIETGSEAKKRDLSQLGYRWDKARTPSDLLDVLDPSKPMIVVNTDRIGKEDKEFGGSVKNIKEARLAVKIANAIRDTYKTDAGRHLEPCILSPYSAQVGEIRQELPDALRSNCITIYRSQGREYPCVIISFVRNNEYGNIGFLGGSEYEMKEQTYVACSRAQAKLILLLSFNTFLNRGHLEFEALCNTKTARIIEAKE